MGCLLRSTTITELHGNPINDGEFKNAFMMVVNALIGTHGNGDWGSGFWVKRGFYWSAKQTLAFTGSIELPFKLKDDICFLHDISGASVTTYGVYVAGGKTVSFPELTGKNVIVQVIDARITKE